MSYLDDRVAPKDFKPYYVGFILQLVLLGLGCCQAFIYFLKNKDGWRVHAFVGTLLFMNMASAGLIAHTVSFYLIDNFGNDNALQHWTLTAIANNFITCAITFCVQIYFASQVYRVTRRGKIAASIIGFFSFVALVSGIALTAELSKNRLIVAMASPQGLISGASQCAFAIFSDLISTVSMCLFLNSARKDTDLRKTQRLIRMLLFLTINRGLLVTIMQLLCMILYCLSPPDMLWSPFFLSLNSLYVNTALAMLNARDSMRSTIQNTINVQIPTTSLMRDGGAGGMGDVGMRSPSHTCSLQSPAVAMGMSIDIASHHGMCGGMCHSGTFGGCPLRSRTGSLTLSRTPSLSLSRFPTSLNSPKTPTTLINTTKSNFKTSPTSSVISLGSLESLGLGELEKGRRSTLG